MDKCVVGDRVQIVGYNSDTRIELIRDGVVTEVTPAKNPKPTRYWEFSEEEQKTFITFVKVKWDDDGSVTEHDLNDLESEDSEMERDFRKAAHYADELIHAQLNIAAEAVREATRIAERYGVPFRTHVSPISNSYTPRSLQAKFEGLDKNFVQDITDTYNDYDSTGWRHSAVC